MDFRTRVTGIPAEISELAAGLAAEFGGATLDSARGRRVTFALSFGLRAVTGGATATAAVIGANEGDVDLTMVGEGVFDEVVRIAVLMGLPPDLSGDVVLALLLLIDNCVGEETAIVRGAGLLGAETAATGIVE